MYESYVFSRFLLFIVFEDARIQKCCPKDLWEDWVPNPGFRVLVAPNKSLYCAATYFDNFTSCRHILFRLHSHHFFFYSSKNIDKLLIWNEINRVTLKESMGLQRYSNAELMHKHKCINVNNLRYVVNTKL